MIDCLLVGHNEMNFAEYEKNISSMGRTSEAYKDLRLNFISYNENKFTAPDLINILFSNRYPPLNLHSTFSATIAYLSSYVNQFGFSYHYVRSFQHDKEKFVRLLEENRILLIAIPTTFYVTMWPIIEIISTIRKTNTTAKIVVGGPFISTQIKAKKNIAIQSIFKKINADFYIDSSQGEYSLCQLLIAIKEQKSFDYINNLYYKKDNQFLRTNNVEERNNLEKNHVNWDLFKDDDLKCCALRTAISCPFNCAFCGYPEHAGSYLPANTYIIKEELDSLTKIGKTKSIHFIDDTFNVPKERFLKVLHLLKDYSFRWHSYIRCQYIDEEIVKLMKESGCEGAFLGIESGSQKILNNMNKNSNIEAYDRGIKLLKKYDIKVFASFLVGFPGESKETISETIDFINKTKPDYYRAQLWYLDPITPIWKQKEKYDIKGAYFNWQHNTMSSMQACDIIDSMFKNIVESIWIPQFSFDFDSLFVMRHNGMSWETINAFLRLFHKSILEILSSQNESANISQSIWDGFKKL